MSKLFILLVLLNAFGAPLRAESAPVTTSMLNLVSNPERLSGKKIEVTGFLIAHRDGVLLFCYPEDYKHVLLKNAVRLELPEALHARARELSGKYVWVEGVFSHVPNEGLLYSGKIENVTVLSFYSDLDRPRGLFFGKPPYVETGDEREGVSSGNGR